MKPMFYQVALETPPNLWSILMFVLILGAAWFAIRFIFKLARRVFMFGCGAILIIGAFLFLFKLITLGCMPTIEQARQWYSDEDPVHDFDHVLRVYRLVELLAEKEGADHDIVRTAALLHDAQGSSPSENVHRKDHHEVSARFAAQVLAEEGWPEEKIAAVQHCILTHRFRSPEIPETIEARVLFDADKLDAIGAIGAVRAVAYAVLDRQPVYAQPSESFINSLEKEPGEAHSSYHEFLFKLAKIKDRLYTHTGKAMAEARHQYLADFFEQLGAEFRGER